MDSKRERIPNLCSREAEGMVTMLFSSESGLWTVNLAAECTDIKGT